MPLQPIDRENLMSAPIETSAIDDDEDDEPIVPWREVFPVHKLCRLFPPMSAAELQALAADIKANGLREKIKLIELPDTRPGASWDTLYIVVDGQNRLDALQLIGSDPWCNIPDGGICDKEFFEVVPLSDDADVAEYVTRMNLCRRNLSGDQCEQLTTRLRAEMPTADDRVIAEEMKADAKLVAAVRRRLLAEAATGTEVVEDGDEPAKQKSKKSKSAKLQPVEPPTELAVAQEGMFG